MVLEMALSLLLCLVFLASAIPKLRHPKGFILTALEYRVLPPVLAEGYARLLPPIELFVSLLLLAGTTVRLAAVIAALLLVSFIAAIGINLARGRDLDCGCFGDHGRRRIGPGLLLQDLGLLAAAVALATLNKHWLALASWSVLHVAGLPSTAAPLALGICAALVVAAAAILPRSRRRRRWRPARQERRWDAETTMD